MSEPTSSRLSSRVRTLRPSPTLAMGALALRLKEAGRSVISLSMGEPDFDTEDFIKEAGIAAIRGNDTKYTEVSGSKAVRQALAEKLKRDNGVTYGIDQILVSGGLKLIIYNAILATVEPGEEVLIPAPYWVSYPDIASLAGARPTFIDCPETRGFRLDPDTLDAAITPKTRMLIINTPNNPTGAAYSAVELKAIGQALHRHPRVLVLTDEIYEHLVYDGFKTVSMAAACPDLYDRIITANGMSKGYVMTGWRLGFAAGPRDIIKAMDTLQSQNLGSPSSIAQAAAIVALKGEGPEGRNSETYMQRNANSFKERRDLAVAAFNRMPGISCHKPEGAFYLFPGCAGVIGKTTPGGRRITNDEDFVTALLEEEGVAAVPGTVFGKSPYFRISYALAKSDLEEGLQRIDRLCRALK